MFYAGLYSLLTGNAPLMAALDGDPYPVLVPENAAYPCLSYQDITESDTYTLDGRCSQEKRVQFDAWGTQYAQSKAIVLALRNLLTCYAGTLSDGTRVLGAFKGNEIDNWEFDGRAFRITVEYHFHIVEA